MTDYIASDWIENTGTVPAGVGPDTRVEVEFWNGQVMQFVGSIHGLFNVDWPDWWRIDNGIDTILRFRFLETPAERDARISRGLAELLDAGRIAEQAGRDE